MQKEIFELADKFVFLKNQKKQKEQELKNINDEIFEVESVLTGFMTLNETQNFTHKDVTFCLKTNLKISAAAGKKEELYKLLKNSGYGSLVTETINSNSLSAFVKEQISENNDKLPNWLNGLINVFEKNTVITRKYKK